MSETTVSRPKPTALEVENRLSEINLALLQTAELAEIDISDLIQD